MKTYTFSSYDRASRFATWLERNTMDRDYGYPQLAQGPRDVGHGEWCVAYEAETPLARGVAIGIDLPT